MKRRKQVRELTENERSLVISVRHCARELDDILQGSRRKMQSDLRLFSELGISTMFRGVDSYADMYEKLNLRSREALNNLLEKSKDAEEIQDTIDAIEETEGYWNTFLSNLDRETIAPSAHENSLHNSASESDNEEKSFQDVHRTFQTEGEFFNASEILLCDLQTFTEVTVHDLVRKHASIMFICQPAYLPDTVIRWRYAEVNKVKADFRNFDLGVCVVTWGPCDLVKSWSKHLARHIRWPIYWDKGPKFSSIFSLKRGAAHLWCTENLQFLGIQRSVSHRAVAPLPTNINWIDWNWFGGEFVMASPTPRSLNSDEVACAVENAMLAQLNIEKSRLQEKFIFTEEKQHEHLIKLAELNAAKAKKLALERRILQAAARGLTHLCVIRVPENYGDLSASSVSGAIYQAALSAYSRRVDKTEAAVMEEIRLQRRFSTPPETARMQLEPSTNLYYDPETKLYYEASSGYFYDPVKSAYYYWSQSEGRYLPADSLIRGQLAEAHSATVALNEASALRRAAEQIAARQAAERVAAQLAEIRAGKDDYAAYAYSTCVAPQHKQLSSGHHNHIQLASASSSSSVASVTSPGARSLLSSGSNTLAHEEAHLPLAYGKAFVAASDIEASLNSWSKPRQASVSNASASVFCPAQYDTEDDIHPPGT